VTGPGRRGPDLRGTAALLGLGLRLDRVRLPVWLAVLAGLTYFSGSSMATTFPTQASLDAYASSVATSPAVVFLAGPPVALDTLAGVVLNKVGFVGLVGAALVAIFETVRHTRTEEEDGRAELVRAGVVGADAPAAAAMLLSAGASLALGLVLTAATAAAQVGWSDALLYGVSVAGLGIVMSAVAAVAAEVLTHGRTAVGAALALFGLAYVVRGVGDVRGDGLVWLSPVGWAQATHPVGAPRWWPLLLPLLATGLLLALASWLRRRRDVGAGLVAERRGRDTATPRLRGAMALALRTQRGLLLAWVLGMVALGTTYGSLTEGVEGLARDNPTLDRFLHAAGQGSLVDAFLATMLLVLALLAAAYSVASASRLSSEEVTGRLEALLATGLSRARWLVACVSATLLGSAVVLAAGGLGLGAAYGMSVGDAGEGLRLAGLELVYLPAVAVLVGLVAVLHGWVPAWVRAVWVVLAVLFVLGYLGELLHAPGWLVRASPFARVPTVPVEPVTVGAPLAIALVFLVLVALGLAGFRRRDVAV
jgi:ABC-2 type transport system permease protein